MANISLSAKPAGKALRSAWNLRCLSIEILIFVARIGEGADNVGLVLICQRTGAASESTLQLPQQSEVAHEAHATPQIVRGDPAGDEAPH